MTKSWLYICFILFLVWAQVPMVFGSNELFTEKEVVSLLPEEVQESEELSESEKKRAFFF